MSLSCSRNTNLLSVRFLSKKEREYCVGTSAVLRRCLRMILSCFQNIKLPWKRLILEHFKVIRHCGDGTKMAFGKWFPVIFRCISETSKCMNKSQKLSRLTSKVFALSKRLWKFALMYVHMYNHFFFFPVALQPNFGPWPPPWNFPFHFDY
jgi:hypothetical protein